MRLPSEVISVKERSSLIFLQCGRVDVEDGAMVLIDERGVRIHIPVGGIACILLEPGTTVTHAAIALAASCGTLLLWVGEAGVRLYSAGQPGGARSDRLLYQARLVLDDTLRLKVVRAMYQFRFKEAPAQHRSIEQLRGIEGARVRAQYGLLAAQYGLKWTKRNYDVHAWDNADLLNIAVSVANHCLYGICEAAVLAAGYAPAMGFIHTGKPLSFVYDIADLFKFDTVIPAAFETVAKGTQDLARRVRLACRDSFRRNKTLQILIPTIEDMLSAGGIEKPSAPQESVPVAITDDPPLGDPGHRR